MSFDPNLCRNESEVESKLIVQYLLPNLGYAPDTWSQEVRIGKVRLDFLASVFGSKDREFKTYKNVVIEAKHPKENLDRHTYKLMRYLSAADAEYGLLTNGKEIRIYQCKEVGKNVSLVFLCPGEEVENNLAEIRKLIGNNYPLIEGEISPRLEKGTTNTKDQQLKDSPELVITEQEPEKLIRENTMKTIAVYHHKGGVGKTTVSVNLAAAFRRMGKRVLLVDLDAQANSTFATGLVKFQTEEDDDLRDQNTFHILENAKINFVPDVVRKSSLFNHPEIDVIPAHISLIERQHKLVGSASSRFRLAKKLSKVQDNYDITIIDTPPSLDIYAQAALVAADYLIIPSDLKPFSHQGLKSVKNFIEQDINDSKENLGMAPIEILGVLPSKISTNTQYLKYSFPQQRDVVAQKYNLPLMDNMISERTALSKCVNETITIGNLEIPDPKSIFNYADNHDAASVAAGEFQALAMEVLEKMGVQ